jgi:cation transport regulator
MYDTRQELPKSVQKVLPDHAQSIYKEAFNSAWHKYKTPAKRRSGNREEVAHKVAWSAVKEKYHKTGGGRWTRDD